MEITTVREAALAGLHTNDCWDSAEHDTCYEIVDAVLKGITDANIWFARPGDLRKGNAQS